jgi:hypothetical protein
MLPGFATKPESVSHISTDRQAACEYNIHEYAVSESGLSYRIELTNYYIVVVRVDGFEWDSEVVLTATIVT